MPMSGNAVENSGVAAGVMGAAGPSAHAAGGRSIYESSYLEALRHKWIASEQAGRDLGEGAITQWLQRHWKGWCRERWIEHLMGRVHWAEFGGDDFGSLARNFKGEHSILERVLERIRCGGENLDIILWASEQQIDIRQVIDILIVADINRPVLERGRLLAERPA